LFIFALRLDSGYASKSKNLASGACGYLQGFTVLLRLALIYLLLLKQLESRMAEKQSEIIINVLKFIFYSVLLQIYFSE
jgi:hypothetical protein